MKLLSLLAILLVTVSSFIYLKPNKGIHAFKVKGLNGETIDFAKFKGKKILVINTASACGYTKQYAALQKVYDSNKDKLVIVGFPCNQFGNQESGSANEIMEFCKKNYGVTFPLSEKVEVKGDNIAPIYKWLCNKSENGVLDATITWNFNKFLIDEKGKMIAYFPSKTTPDSDEILKYLK